MASSAVPDNEIPQWKKDLIARLRNQNKRTAIAAVAGGQQQLYAAADPPQITSAAVDCHSGSVQQPGSTCSSSGGPHIVLVESVASVNSRGTVDDIEKCNNNQSRAISAVRTSNQIKTTIMVQERVWVDHDTHNNNDYEMSLGELCVAGGKNGGGGDYNRHSDDSDSSEDLPYGPGIVNKLKNKYLSLALRESNGRTRPTILRKAASLENMLDDGGDDDDGVRNGTIDGGNHHRLFQTRLSGSNDTGRNVPNRYRNATRGSDLKRARSVEAISSAVTDCHHNNLIVSTDDIKTKRESLHEEMLIIGNDNEGNDKCNRKINDNILLLSTTLETKAYSHNIGNRINRPKKIAPVMNEKEKPPVDVVKQAKLIFERRPEQRTKPPHSTGEVAAKVATYKNIIVQAKSGKKPPIKHKPIGLGNLIRSAKPNLIHLDNEEQIITTINEINKPKPNNNDTVLGLISPIPDVSRIDFLHHADINNEMRGSNNCSLSETPDLILTSSPITAVSSLAFNISATVAFIKEEIRHSNRYQESKISLLSPIKSKLFFDKCKDEPDSPLEQKPVIPPQSSINHLNATGTVTFNFAKTNDLIQNHLPVNKNISNTKTPPSQPLKLDVNGVNNVTETKKLGLSSPNRILQQCQNDATKTPPTNSRNQTSPSINNNNNNNSIKPNLTTLEIEKNLINTAKSMMDQPKVVSVNNVKSFEEVIKMQVPKVKRPAAREPESNSIVFKFTDRKDVPDYVHNDTSRLTAKIEKPKVGDGGIILLSGAAVDESFTDEDDEIMRSLESPPSPCDVTFINDNILIDGKSSLSQKTKRSKMNISFVEAGPDIFEYPSESSLLLEDPSTSPANSQMGHTVASLTGSSSLANYTPKSTEEFQPGVTRSSSSSNNIQNIPIRNEDDIIKNENSDLLLQEIEQPILFSAGTNSDMLF